MNTPSVRQSLESIAWAVVGLSLVASLGFCVVGVAVTLVVEHIGWFDALAPMSSWMLDTLHVAAYVFATCCVLVTLGASGAHMAVVVPAAFAILFAFGAISYGFVQLLLYLKPAFAVLLSNLWWAFGAVVTFVLLCFAVSTSPRSGYGYLLFGIVSHAAVLSGLCTYAVFVSDGFSSWSPWIRLLLSCGITTTCLGVGLSAIRMLVSRWPPSDDTRNTLETWLVPLGSVAVFVTGYGVWHFATSLLDYESGLAKLIAGLAVSGGLAFGALITIGAIAAIIEKPSESAPQEQAP